MYQINASRKRKSRQSSSCYSHWGWLAFKLFVCSQTILVTWQKLAKDSMVQWPQWLAAKHWRCPLFLSQALWPNPASTTVLKFQSNPWSLCTSFTRGKTYTVVDNMFKVKVISQYGSPGISARKTELKAQFKQPTCVLASSTVERILLVKQKYSCLRASLPNVSCIAKSSLSRWCLNFTLQQN